MINIFPVSGLPQIQPGDDLPEMIFECCGESDAGLVDGDVLVVTQKIISKAEGRQIGRAHV